MEQLAYDSDHRLELMQDFSAGSRLYCLSALKMISDDGKVDLVRFQTWLDEPENFLFFPLPKFKVMLWAFDLFYQFDVDGDGQVPMLQWYIALMWIHACNW